MLPLLTALSSLIIGGFLGWYFRDIRERLKTIAWLQHEASQDKPHASGVVRPTLKPGMQPQQVQSDTRGGIVRPKTPKQIAADQARKFNNEFEV